MKFTFSPMPTTQFAISAELVEYDAAPPIECLLVDREPRARHNDRDAMAAYLAFGHWIGSGMTLPKPISPATAEAIQSDMRNGSSRVEPIEYYPKALPIGTTTFTLSAELSETFAARPELAVLRADRWNGALATGDSLAFGSNAFLLSIDGGVRAYLAVAVLFATDLGADEYDLSAWHVSEDEQMRLRALLSSVRLGATFR